MAVGDLSFAFRPEKGETPDAVAKRRAIAEAIAARQFSGAPRNVGEGLNSIGQALLYRRLMGGVGEAERVGQESASEAFSSLFGGGPQNEFPPAPTSPAASAPGASAGGMDAYQNAIASIESAGSGDYAAVGPTHPRLGRALGKYQVMEANIGPWSREALGREVTPDEFLASPEIQDAVFNAKFGQYVQQYGPEGAAQAWFAGPGGVGKMGREDALGTSVAEYTDKFRNAVGSPGVQAINEVAQMQEVALQPPAGGAQEDVLPMQPMPMQEGDAMPSGIDPRIMNNQPMGGAPMPMQGAPAQVAQADVGGGIVPGDPSTIPAMAGGTRDVIQPGQRGDPGLSQIVQALGNPWLSDSQRRIGEILLQQELQQNAPVEPTAEMRNLEWRAQQAGLQPGTPEYNDFILSGGSGPENVINVGGGSPGLGKLSSDYGYVLDPDTGEPVIDPETGLPQAAPVPGSPAAREQQQEGVAAENKEEQRTTWNAIVNQEIGRALDIMDTANLPTTGMIGDWLSGLGGTAARDLKGLLDTVKANAGFDRLQAMRDASPTGGALGQVSERELAFLQSTIGNLEQSQTAEQLRFNLKRLQKIYQNMLDGKRAYDGLLEPGGGGDLKEKYGLD